MQAYKGVTTPTERLQPMPASQIRPATPSDLAAVRAIAEAAYRPYVARNGLEPAPLHEDYAARIAASQTWVLTDAGEVRGFVVLLAGADHMMLDNIAVAPTAHGRGYGRALMDFAESRAAQAGLPAIRLYTQEIMVENLAIYAARGYLQTHRAREAGLDRVYMEKRL